MFGGEPLMAFADGEALGRLQEPPRAVGEFLNVHVVLQWHATGAEKRSPLRPDKSEMKTLKGIFDINIGLRIYGERGHHRVSIDIARA
jgi:hypothetical protein